MLSFYDNEISDPEDGADSSFSVHFLEMNSSIRFYLSLIEQY